MHFMEKPNIDPGKIIQLIQTRPGIYRMDGRDKLRIVRELPNSDQRFDLLENLFTVLAVSDAA